MTIFVQVVLFNIRSSLSIFLALFLCYSVRLLIFFGLALCVQKKLNIRLENIMIFINDLYLQNECYWVDTILQCYITQ